MALQCERVRVDRGGRRVLDGVSFRLERGRAIALLGPNGAGKSTVLQTALGLLAPSEGHIELDERPVRRWSRFERAARLAWLPQDVAPTEPLPAWEWVASARYRFKEPFSASADAARRMLDELGAGALAERLVSTLSGGERQRVALAALFAQEADFLLADEPAGHLDPAQQLESYRRLGTQVRSGRGLLLVTHDVNLLAALDCPVDIVGLRDGRTHFTLPYPKEGLPDSLTEGLQALFGVPFASAVVGGRPVIIAQVGS